MKRLTYSAMAAARLRANKRQYRSLVLGIFLSVFLVSSLVLSVYGIYLAQLDKRAEKIGNLDMVMLENDFWTDEDLVARNIFDKIGHAYISGIVTDCNLYVGYYDEPGVALLNLQPVEGRLPEAPGEIAMERSALDVLDVRWQLGEEVELSITPVDGAQEKRTFTLVGFLPERSVHLGQSDHNGLSQFPAIVTSESEPAFSVGRLGTQYVMHLKKGISVNDGIGKMWKGDGMYTPVGSYAYGFTITGNQQRYFTEGIGRYMQQELIGLVSMACALAASLILSCAVGISGAMEGLLSRRREEIGVLRALGATRRQIRRMFGRENLILALVVSPVSIGLSCGAIWLLSVLLPGTLVFRFPLWLIGPIAMFSVAVILLSGYLPLARASKMMPMSVIRDTAMLRRSKRVRTKKVFRPTHLIAARQIRFHPTRQIGASLLVGLMLLCGAYFAGASYAYVERSVGEEPGFRVDAAANWAIFPMGITLYEQPSMSMQSIRQIQSLQNVKRVTVNRQIQVSLLLDKVPRYAMLDGYLHQFYLLDDAQFEEAKAYVPGDADELAYYDATREHDIEEYQQFRRDYQIEGIPFSVALSTVDLNEQTISNMNTGLQSGGIHPDAINAGQEVIVVAPEYWLKKEERYSVRSWESEEAVKNDPAAEGAKLVAWNDAFTAGQTLSMMQLLQTEEDGKVYRQDETVTIGAVTSTLDRFGHYWGGVTILTTEQGLANMALSPEGVVDLSVYLSGEPTDEDVETLERQITAIARRTGYTVTNQVERRQEARANNLRIWMLVGCVSVLFFSVAVGMIVSSVTRQLNSEGRTIGMLRAVGADERAILGCYSGRVTASVVGGLGICMTLFLLYLAIYIIDAIMYSGAIFGAQELRLIGIMVGTFLGMSAACYAACRYLLRLRIRSIVNKSIIDNIREL